MKFPTGYFAAAENVLPKADKSIIRAGGIDAEDDYIIHDTGGATLPLNTEAISSHTWFNVARKESLNYRVQQIGSTLTFWDLTTIPISNSKKTFTFNLNTYSKPSGQPANAIIQTSSISGVLVVTSPELEPFYIKYNPTSDTITTTKINIQIRDFDDVYDTIGATQTNWARNPFSVYNNSNYPTGGRSGESFFVFTYGQNPDGNGNDTRNNVARNFYNGYTTVRLNGTDEYTIASTSTFQFGATYMVRVNLTTPLTKNYRGQSNERKEVVTIQATAYPNDFEPPALSLTHEYNLKNRGWVKPSGRINDPITDYFNKAGKYPPKSKQWWSGMDSVNKFDPALLERLYSGSASAPKGHYLVDRFAKQRLDGRLPTVYTTERPEDTIGWQGRVFYGFKNNILFSQTLIETSDDTLTNRFGACYQDADPTSQDISDLIATDGGEIIIPEMTNFKRFFAFGSNLLLYADNGIWVISGDEAGEFKATAYSVNRITDEGLSSKYSLVNAKGQPYWWGKRDIYTFSLDQVSQNPTIQSLSTRYMEDNGQRLEIGIRDFLSNISTVAKTRIRGEYDSFDNRIRWIYNSNDDNLFVGVPYYYDKELVFDIISGGFFPLSIPVGTTPSTAPVVVDIFRVPDSNATIEQNAVVVGTDSVVADGDNVLAGTRVASYGVTTPPIMYLVLFPYSSSRGYTFARRLEKEYSSYRTLTGNPITDAAYFESGYLNFPNSISRRYIPYIYTQTKKTETEFVQQLDGSYEFDYPSGVFVRAKWDFATSSTSNKWTPQQQAYRFTRPYIIDPSDLTFNYPFDVITTKLKLTGTGKSVKIRYDSDGTKAFNIIGYTLYAAISKRI